jgi:hypothetical protein
MLPKGSPLPNAFLPSASELLSSGSSSALCHAPAPFSTLHCKSASLCPAPSAVGAAAAAFKPADIAAAAGFEYFLFSAEMWNNLFLPWTSSENVAVADPPQLFFDHDSTLDSCHLFLRCSPDWVVVLARVQHLRQRVLLQARSALPDVCSLALQSIYASAPDCFLVYPGKRLCGSCVVLRGSRCCLSGDADPAAAVALSLAADDVVTLADSSVEMLDRAGPTSVAIEDKCVCCGAPVVGAARSSFCVAQVVSGLQCSAAFYGFSPRSCCIAHVTCCALMVQ